MKVKIEVVVTGDDGIERHSSCTLHGVADSGQSSASFASDLRCDIQGWLSEEGIACEQADVEI